MRLVALALIAPFLALAGCGKEETAANTAAVDENVSAADFAASDATAIDAATGADANMAADVEINFTGEDPDADRATSNRSSSGARPRPSVTNTAAPANDTQAPVAEPAAPPAESNAN